ncbi:MAG: response regulator [Chthonomonadales bacterium]|nr:response regulator [Chthonomonadales bacterium]
MKVAIVEDDPGSRRFMEETVKSLGYEMRSAEDGLSGLDLVRDWEPHIVLLDIQLPGMDGLDVLGAIRDEGIDTIVIINTAFGTEDHAIRALRLRANDYLRKPVRHAELIPMLRKFEEIVAAREAPTALPEFVRERRCSVEIANDLHVIARVADYLANEAEMSRNRPLTLGITLGLVELLNNAVEHGNLGIGSADKAAALAASPSAWRQLVEERKLDPERAARTVTVEMVSTREYAEWLITDQGEGFDWRAYMDTLDTPDPLALHGRGIFLATCYFDRVEYLGAGNSVRVRKSKLALADA